MSIESRPTGPTLARFPQSAEARRSRDAEKTASARTGTLLELKKKSDADTVTLGSASHSARKTAALEKINEVIADQNMNLQESPTPPSEDEINSILAGLGDALRNAPSGSPAMVHSLDTERALELLKED